MPKALGLMNPENAAKGGGAFKEGVVRITSNCYTVHQSKGGEGMPDTVPATKWKWVVERLQENGEDVMRDEHDEPVKDEMLFSLGGKCLPFVRPGKADGPDDDEPEDLGTTLGVEGNTIYLGAVDWRPNEKSGLMTLTRSLAAHNVDSKYLNRCWCPDWNGCVFEMKTQASVGADGKAFNYKIVSKVMVGPGGGSGGGKKGSGKSASNGKVNEAEATLSPILHALSQELDGGTITRKAFLNRVRGVLDGNGVDSKLLVPVLSLCKDDKWLESHAQTFDFALDAKENTITFGVPTNF